MKKDQLTQIIIFIIAMIGILIYWGADFKSEPKVQTREQSIAEAFSAWDGSHNQLTSHIKSTMKNPSSYRHVSTRYGDKGTHLIISTTFQGTNSFGAIVTQTVTTKVKLNGTIIKVLNK